MALRSLVAIVFGVAAVGKARDWREAVAATAGLTGWSGAMGKLATVGVIALEALISLSLVRGGYASLTFAGAVLLLVVFTLAQIRSIRLGQAANCACFGRRVEQVSGLTITRNAVLIAAAVIGAFLDGAVPVEPAKLVAAVTAGVVAAMILVSLRDVAFVLGFKTTIDAAREEHSQWP